MRNDTFVRNLEAAIAFIVGALFTYLTLGRVAGEHFMAKEAMVFFVMLFGWTAQTVIRVANPYDGPEMDRFIVGFSAVILVAYMVTAGSLPSAIMKLACGFLGTCTYFALRESMRAKLGFTEEYDEWW